MATTVKKFCVNSHRKLMAIQPNPDNIPRMMQEDFGTKVLITDVAADKLLEKAARLGNERYRKWCGGKDGFDDFCERMH